jgi:hypothetical protein
MSPPSTETYSSSKHAPTPPYQAVPPS